MAINEKFTNNCRFGLAVFVSVLLWTRCHCSMTLNATATGSSNGASICPLMPLGTNITCITDHSDDTVQKGKMWLELNFHDPGCVSYDYTMSGYKTIHLYCVFDDNWYYDKQTIYVGEEITGVKVGDENGNTFIPMTSSADIYISYENGSDVTLEIESNTTGVSLLSENMTSSNQTFVISGSDFSNIYGQYVLRFTLSNVLNTVDKWVVIMYEEAIAGFVFTGATVPIVHIGDSIPISFTLTSGTDVVIVVDIGTLSLIEKCNGELRSHSLTYTANETGTYPITITLSNFFSIYNHSFEITVQYPVNNITITRTETMMVGDSNPMTFVMDSIAMIPMGDINANISIYENHTHTLQTKSVSLTTLNPGGNQIENVDSYYTGPGYYVVHAMIYSEIHHVNYTWLKIVEHELSLEIVATLSVPLSKAEQEIGVTILNSLKSPLYRLHCSFDIDGDIVNQTFDSLVYGNNATITYFYSGDGNKTLTVTCSNNLRTWTSKTYVDVYTDCFESTQLFDSVYKTANTPLKVYVTDVTQITGKVVVSDKCKNSSRTYWWDFYDVDWTDLTTLTKMGYYNDSQNQPAGITITFAEEAIEPGLKKLSLTTNLTEAEGAVLIDHIFVDFQVPTIFAAIKGGSQRIVSNQAALEVDAISLSKEPYNKVKHIPFDFSWSCRTIIHSTTNENDIAVKIALFKSPNPDIHFETSYGADCSSLIQNPTSGKITLDQADLTPDHWYLFFVNVSKNITTSSTPPLLISRDDKAVQAVHVVSYQPPNIGIRCLRNCREKASRDTLINVEVTCDSCAVGSTTYQWQITKFEPAPVNSFGSLSALTESQVIVTETNTDTLAIQPKYLNYGDKIRVKCTVNENGRIADTSYYFSINEPPYNGTCTITPETGRASLDYFEIKCSSWKDEEDRYGRDLSLDSNVPLIYKVYQISNSTSNDTSSAVLSETPEPVSKALLSIGDPYNDYTADVRVKITDKNNGFQEVFLDVKVTNPLKDLINDSSAINTEDLIQDMSEFVEKVLEDARATKDPIMVMKASESIASVITDFAVENKTHIDVSKLPTEWHDGLLDATVNGTMKAFDDILTDILQKPVDKYQDAASEKVQNLTQIMFDELQGSNFSTFYSIEISANAFANVISNSDFTNDEAAKLASQALGQLVESFSNITQIQVSPDAVFTSGTTSLEDSKEGLVLLINNVITVTVKSDLHNDSDAILAAQAVADSRKYVDIMTYIEGHTAYTLMENASITPEERVGLYFMRSRIADLDVKRQKYLAAVTGEAVDSALESVTQTLLAVICKGCTDTTEKSNILVYVQKDTLGEMNAQGLVQDNTTINRIAVGDAYLSLAFPSSLVQNPNTNYSTVMFSTSVLQRNTYIFDQSNIGVLISSPAYKLTLTGDNQEPITLTSINIYEPTTQVVEEEYLPSFTPEDASELFYHTFLYRKIGDYVCILIEQSAQPIHVQDYTVYLRQETFPTHLDYDMKTVLSYDKDWMSCFPPDQMIKTGLVYVGLSARPVPGETGYEWTPTEGKYYPGTYNITDPRLSPYKIKIITSGCETWNEKKKEWGGMSCGMDWHPSADMISCQCGGTKGMTFGNTFYVPPNTIDFSTVFLKFSPKDQAAVLATFSVVLVFYIILMLWGRHQDKKDVVKWGVTPLIDNFADDTYYYLVTVYTGMRRDAGTKSRIGFIVAGDDYDSGVRELYDGVRDYAGMRRDAGTKSRIGFIVAGDDYDSGVRELYDGVRDEFPTASVQHFLMATSFPLGELTYVYIFHDNSGEGAYSSWYLNRLDIEDLQERTRYVFLCGQWLSLDDEDSSVDAILPVCGKENVTTFQNMFYLNTKENLADNHMWVSIFYRPTSSNFTRCQRISCLLLFIMLTMIGNAIYFRPEDEFQVASVVRVGPLQFSWRTVYISLASTLIATPAVLFSILLFKKAKPRKINTDVKEKALKYAVPVLDNMMDKWLKESKELEQTLVAKGYFGMEAAFLPWWFIIIAWIITIGGSITAAFFVMLYSMEWGKQKTEVWLSQFAMSFFQSIFIVDPLKVIVVAAVFALILTQLEKFRPSGLKRDIILKNYRQRFGKESSIRIPVPPLSNDMLERARQDRMREVKMMQSIKEIAITVIFLWIIFSISYSNRDHRSYLIHSAVENQLLTPAKPLQQYDKILTHDDYVKWLSETVFPAIFPEKDYDGELLHWRWRQYFSDLTNFRVGPPRLRQLRVTKTMEDIPIVGLSTVYPNYKILNEEDRDFCFSWQAPPCDEETEAYSFSYRAWKFTKASSIWGIPIAGLYNTYGGGGYIAELDVNWDFSNRTLKELTDYLWINSATRAVFLEILLYNPNSNLFIYCTFITEFPETGGIIKMYSMYPLRIYQHLGATGIYVIFCEVCFLLYLVALIVRVTYGIYQHRAYYFKSTWRTVDFLGVIGGLVGIVMYFGRLLLANETMSNFREDPKTFVNFQHIAIWDLLFVLLLGCLVFLATIRLLGILGYDKRIGQVFKVFDNCAWDLFWFGVLFFYIFLGYCAFGYLLFGRSLESYYNVFEAMGTLFISMIGKSKFTEMNEKDPVMAQFYFFTFILLMVYFLLTMFLAMLGESISVVQAKSKVDRSEELVLYLIEKFRDIFGGRKSRQTKTHKNFSSTIDSEKPLNLLHELRCELGSVMSNISGSKALEQKMEKKGKSVFT